MTEAALDHDDFRISLYYCYVTIEDIDVHIEFQKSLCESLGLKGRLRISSEGLNGVFSGRSAELNEYEALLQDHLTDLAGDRPFNLDIKYCRLRKDLDIEAQLFQELIVQRTTQVISLVELHDKHATKKSKRRQQSKTEREPSTESELVESIWRKAQERIGFADSSEYLSPSEWNERLTQVSEDDDAILLDCRNFYESNIGHFASPMAHTILTNTRKYQELPLVLLQEKERIVASKQVFMYCTGGVRCERASVFLKTLLSEEGNSHTKVFQLRGGIQRYLEHIQNDEVACSFYRGKNFVFDPRRTDPLNGNGDVVGKCLLCGNMHDDYDNGHAPSENKEARCCTCRILVLVCNSCRPTVACWGDDTDTDKQQIYCGITDCVHRPKPRLIQYDY